MYSASTETLRTYEKAMCLTLKAAYALIKPLFTWYPRCLRNAEEPYDQGLHGCSQALEYRQKCIEKAYMDAESARNAVDKAYMDHTKGYAIRLWPIGCRLQYKTY